MQVYGPTADAKEAKLKSSMKTYKTNTHTHTHTHTHNVLSSQGPEMQK